MVLPMQGDIFAQFPLKSVQSTTLEIRCTRKCTVGSNPTRCAITRSPAMWQGLLVFARIPNDQGEKQDSQ